MQWGESEWAGGGVFGESLRATCLKPYSRGRHPGTRRFLGRAPAKPVKRPRLGRRGRCPRPTHRLSPVTVFLRSVWRTVCPLFLGRVCCSSLLSSLSRARGRFFLIFSSRFHQLHRFALCFLASAPSFGAQLGFYRSRFHVVSRLLASFVLGGICVCVCVFLSVCLSVSLCALSLARFGGWWCFCLRVGSGKRTAVHLDGGKFRGSEICHRKLSCSPPSLCRRRPSSPPPPPPAYTF